MFFMAFFCHSGWSQNTMPDSLSNALKAVKADTARVNLLLEISAQVFRSQPDTAIFYASQAKALAERVQFQSGLAYALKNIGLAHYIKGEYPEVLSNWEQSLAIFRSIDDKLGVANLLNNIGAVYFNQGDDPKALEYYLESLKVSEELGVKLRIATALNNIGAVYFNKAATHDKALAYYLQALPLSEEIGDLDAIGTSAVNLGEIYLEKEKLDSALFYFRKALDAYESSGGNSAYALNNIGKVYSAKGDYEEAMKFHQDAYDRARRVDGKLEMTQALIGQANTLRAWGRPGTALSKLTEAQSLAREIGSYYELEATYEGLAATYADMGDYQRAFQYGSLLNGIRDTLYDIEDDKRMESLLFQFEIEKKESEIELLNRDNELKEAQIRQAATLRNFLFAIATLLIVIIGGISYQYRYARRSNKIISEERNRSEAILLNILPKETAEELKANGTVRAKRFDQTTVLFADFKDFTKFSETLPPEELVKSVDYYFRHFDEIISRHKLEKIKTIGDAYMCAGGLPKPDPQNAVRTVRAALEMAGFVESLSNNLPKGILLFQVRIGINTGTVVAGVVGTKKFQYDIWGSTVNLAAMMESNSLPGRVNISEYTYQLIKDEFAWTYRGEIEAKHGEKFKMYFVDRELEPAEV